MIIDYGWSDALAQTFISHAAAGHAPGRVTAQHRGHYGLATDHGDLDAHTSGRLAHGAQEGDHPVVGDWVALTARPEEGTATIHAVLPRRTLFSRRAANTAQTAQAIAANIDVAFLVTSMNAEFNPRRLERYLASAWASGARPVVVLTKADLTGEAAQIVAAAQAAAREAAVVAVSAATGEGLDALGAHLRPGETCVLLGSSGVGKSTLVNALAGELLMSAGSIREDDARGRHTTTHRQLLRLPGGALVMDTPGMREFGLMDADAGLEATFADIEALAQNCRFADCGHDTEPGCAVRRALDAGELDPARWRSFRKLGRELAHMERREDHLAREAERKRWIAINKAQRSARRDREKW